MPTEGQCKHSGEKWKVSSGRRCRYSVPVKMCKATFSHQINEVSDRVDTVKRELATTVPARVLCLMTAALVGGVFLANAQDRNQARSMVISKGGIVASESPLAARAGVRILESGGNAVDAAIATNAMMGVVEPMMNGIGGDLFAIVYDAKANKLYGLNASGWAPKGLTIEFLQKQGLREMPQKGINAVTVPGA